MTDIVLTGESPRGERSRMSNSPHPNPLPEGEGAFRAPCRLANRPPTLYNAVKYTFPKEPHR